MQKLINRTLRAKQLLLTQWNSRSTLLDFVRVELINSVIPLTLNLRTDNALDHWLGSSECCNGSSIEESSRTVGVNVCSTKNFATHEGKVDVVVAADIHDEVSGDVVGEGDELVENDCEGGGTGDGCGVGNKIAAWGGLVEDVDCEGVVVLFERGVGGCWEGGDERGCCEQGGDKCVLHGVGVGVCDFDV